MVKKETWRESVKKGFLECAYEWPILSLLSYSLNICKIQRAMGMSVMIDSVTRQEATLKIVKVLGDKR